MALGETSKNAYRKNGKDDVVSRTIYSSTDGGYDPELGIPRQLVSLKNSIFGSLPLKDRRDFRLEFLKAIPVGANLMIPYWQFMSWLLVDPEDGVIRFAKNNRTKKALKDVATLYLRMLNNKVISTEEWRNADSAIDIDAFVYMAAYADAATYIPAYIAAYAHIASASIVSVAAIAAACAAAYAACITAAGCATDRIIARKKQAEKLIELLKIPSVRSQDDR